MALQYTSILVFRLPFSAHVGKSGQQSEQETHNYNESYLLLATIIIHNPHTEVQDKLKAIIPPRLQGRPPWVSAVHPAAATFLAASELLVQVIAPWETSNEEQICRVNSQPFCQSLKHQQKHGHRAKPRQAIQEVQSWKVLKPILDENDGKFNIFSTSKPPTFRPQP